jgi:hypothetical protein
VALRQRTWMFIDDGVEGLPVGRDGKRSNTGDVVCDANIGHRPNINCSARASIISSAAISPAR